MVRLCPLPPPRHPLPPAAATPTGSWGPGSDVAAENVVRGNWILLPICKQLSLSHTVLFPLCLVLFSIDSFYDYLIQMGHNTDSFHSSPNPRENGDCWRAGQWRDREGDERWHRGSSRTDRQTDRMQEAFCARQREQEAGALPAAEGRVSANPHGPNCSQGEAGAGGMSLGSWSDW